ncbi:MAG: hypothetical protein COZ48_00335 [Candidatus Yonathbacteria bacterium CG_4_10_14_3_um_filter_43_12]|nr:MAG: hypothetical protein COZ48_00335 [Candidatus Yonathbacteria bacterium CG_4_10_14_3_um_filter_43_12]
MIKYGYEWRCYTDPDGLVFIRLGPDGEKLENIHVCDDSSEKVHQFIVIRNYLRANPDKAKEYSELKRQNIILYPNDYPAYRNAKAPFLKKLEQEASVWERGK